MRVKVLVKDGVEAYTDWTSSQNEQNMNLIGVCFGKEVRIENLMILLRKAL